jgi:cell division protein FtsI/penicillin-binding protein 2
MGFAGDYNQGLEGIEVAYDKQLAGINGCLLVEYDAAGHEIPESTRKYVEPEQGLNVVLTIDQTIQYIAERELDKIMQERSPKSASIIVMDPDTGEILALANRPDFDPNKSQQRSCGGFTIGAGNSYDRLFDKAPCQFQFTPNRNLTSFCCQNRLNVPGNTGADDNQIKIAWLYFRISTCYQRNRKFL